MQRIVIPTQKDKYYRQLLELVRSMKPFNSLNNKDLDVLAMMLEEYYDLQGLLFEKRCNYIFSTEVRKKIYTALDMSGASFGNSITKLRKVGLIEGNLFNKKFINNMRPQNKLEIIFKWKQESQ